MYNFFIFFRKIAFWLIDFLNRRAIRKNYNDVKYQFYNYSSDKSIKLRKKNLNNILQHAKKSVKFYNKVSDSTGLNGFPVVNKSIIKDHINDFISDTFKDKKLFSTTTSGSTGTPFTVYRDKGKIRRHQAENIFFSEIAGYKLGSRIYYLRVWNEINKKSKLKTWFENIAPIEIGNLSDKSIEDFLLKLKADKNFHSILSFASSLELIARYLERSSIDSKIFNVQSIIAMSEPITVYARKTLESFFSCPVVLRYSNMENGFIAQQQTIDETFRINHSSFHIEILDLNDDKPTPYGELGRIVVTDLFNYAMPLIRYDTGDTGVLIYDEEYGPCLSTIEGRRVDFIKDTSGQFLSPHSITNTMWRYSDILQFQFIQENIKEYKIKINIKEDNYSREKSLINDLKIYLGDDADVKVEIVHEIPMLSSGKRKKIVNNIK